MKYFLYSAMVVLMCIAVGGCSSEPQPSQRAVARRAEKKKAAKKKKVVDQNKTEKKAEPEPYRYSSVGKADPFVPLLVDTSTALNDERDDRDKSYLTPLQKYDLDDLKLVAVVVVDGEPTAMLEDPTGYGYVIRKGMLVGPNDGVVERVVPTGLIVKEKFYNELGEIESKISTLTIQQVE